MPRAWIYNSDQYSPSPPSDYESNLLHRIEEVPLQSIIKSHSHEPALRQTEKRPQSKLAVPAQSPSSDADTVPQGHSLRPRGQTRTWSQAIEVSSDEDAEGIPEPEVDDEDSHSAAEISSTMEKVGPVVLRPSWLQDYTTPLLLVCRACLKEINIQNGISHATGKENGGHRLRVGKEAAVELKEWMERKAQLFLSSTTAFHDAPSSAFTPKPLPIRAFDDTLQCTSKGCGYCCLHPNAIATHWSKKHRGKRTTAKSKIVTVQTFFETHPRYFVVNPHLSGLLSNSLYELYERQLVPEMEEECDQAVPYLASERDIPPLLKIMQCISTSSHTY